MPTAAAELDLQDSGSGSGGGLHEGVQHGVGVGLTPQTSPKAANIPTKFPGNFHFADIEIGESTPVLKFCCTAQPSVNLI